ncbi:hypothetical protein H4Q26_010286 [Puccinia striiformis f. sp. tritici PST-130]|nr:hypothetical protein H4Q26_010286 [Puccinia striiformis f. sp. tritici PST-130]
MRNYAVNGGSYACDTCDVLMPRAYVKLLATTQSSTSLWFDTSAQGETPRLASKVVRVVCQLLFSGNDKRGAGAFKIRNRS